MEGGAFSFVSPVRHRSLDEISYGNWDLGDAPGQKLRDNDRVMAQVQNNTREQALKADLPDAATDAIVEALTSHRAIAERLLSNVSAQRAFYGLLYDILKQADAAKLLQAKPETEEV